MAVCVNGKRIYNIQKAACGCLCKWKVYVKTFRKLSVAVCVDDKHIICIMFRKKKL